MRLESIAIDQLKSNSWKPNEMDEPIFQSLVQSIRTNGFQTAELQSLLQSFPVDTHVELLLLKMTSMCSGLWMRVKSLRQSVGISGGWAGIC